MTVHIACVIDKSGSMYSLANDSIGGFNAFLEGQQLISGDAKFTLALFNDDYDLIHENKALSEVPKLTEKTYRPSGSTALYDAIGNIIVKIDKHKADEDKVIFVILTDGEENSSKEFDEKAIAEMISQHDDWEFVFLAANQDAFATGQQLNIKPGSTRSYTSSQAGTRAVYGEIHDTVSAYRAGNNIDSSH